MFFSENYGIIFSGMIYLFQFLASLLAVMIIISLHEFAHAFVAYKYGDPTAKFSGRMTLNPVRHFDPLGVLMFAVAGFGWAKPVPINPRNFKNYTWGSFWTSAAGIIVNYLTAFIFCPLLALVHIYVLPKVDGTYAYYFLDTFFWTMVLSSLSFCVFNLLPLFPLDGFRMVDALNKRRGNVYQFLYKYGQYILLGLILIHFIAGRIPEFWVIDILGHFMNYVVRVFSIPITAFWEWIFELCGTPVRFGFF